MIPIHERSTNQKSNVVIHELQELTEYDSTELHRHNYFEFFVFEKGGGKHWIDFESIPIEDNSVHIVAPGQVHHVKRELTSKGFVFLFDHGLFNFNKQVEEFLFDHICLSVQEFHPNYTFDSEGQNKLIEVANKAWNENQTQNEFRNLLIQNLLSEMILYCMQSIRYATNQHDAAENDLYLSFRRMLKLDFKVLKKVKEYASNLATSEKRLNEIVNHRTGQTASTLIYKQIILEAKRLLNTGVSSKEIAYELNFKDPAHFSKFFKGQTGISPSEFGKVHDSD